MADVALFVNIPHDGGMPPDPAIPHIKAVEPNLHAMGAAAVTAPSLTPAMVRATLRHVDAELYEAAVPFEGTAARLLSVTEAVAEMITANVGKLTTETATLIAKAQHAVLRRDLLAARDFILDALATVPARRPGSRANV